MIGKLRKGFESKARSYHGRTPGVRKLPLPAIAIILVVAFVNALTWVAAGIISHYHGCENDPVCATAQLEKKGRRKNQWTDSIDAGCLYQPLSCPTPWDSAMPLMQTTSRYIVSFNSCKCCESLD